MYQIEIKRWLVQHQFNPEFGWRVHVDIDAMERGKGPQNSEEKRIRASIAETALLELGATLKPHPTFGRVDVVAEHPMHGIVLIEVEGQSSRQLEQAVYSSVGQLITLMNGETQQFALAVPDSPEWQRQIAKIPSLVKTKLGLSCYLVSENACKPV
jgi:hypothetical protein